MRAIIGGAFKIFIEFGVGLSVFATLPLFLEAGVITHFGFLVLNFLLIVAAIMLVDKIPLLSIGYFFGWVAALHLLALVEVLRFLDVIIIFISMFTGVVLKAIINGLMTNK